MRLLRSASLALGAFLVSGIAVAACSAKHDPAPGEILLAIDANLRVPGDIDQLGVSVIAQDGTVASIDQIYPMSPVGDAKFPATLAIVRGTSQPVDIKVAAFKGGTAFVLREAVTTIPENRTAILRLDLNWLDTGSTSGAVTKVQTLATGAPCVAGQTSVAGTCQSFTLDSDSLPTYTSGALVPAVDAGGVCVDVVDCMLGQEGAVIPPVSVPQPALGSVASPDGGTQPSCTLVPPFSGAFNIGMVPKSGAAGWCNGNGCVLPLENDAAEGWPVSSADNLVHLPLGVCTSTKIASLLVSQVTPGCPQYGAVAHPACQDYGEDGGTSGGADGGPRIGDGGPKLRDGGGDDDGGTTDGAPSNANIIVQTELGESSEPLLGLAVDTTTGRTYTARPIDGGTVVEYRPVTDDGQGSPPVAVATLDASATSIAAASDRVALATSSGVQVFLLDGGTDVFFPGSSVSAVAYEPTAAGPRLVMAGVEGRLAFAGPTDTSATIIANFIPAPSLLAYDDERDAFLVVAPTAQNEPALYYVTLDASGETAPSPAPLAVLSGQSTVTAVAFADPQTAVWVDQGGHFFTAPTSGDAGTGTQLAIDAGFSGSAQALAARDGRVVWAGGELDLWTARIVGGALVDTPIDLAPRATINQSYAINVSQVAVSVPLGLVEWANVKGAHTGNVNVTFLAQVPQ